MFHSMKCRNQTLKDSSGCTMHFFRRIPFGFYPLFSKYGLHWFCPTVSFSVYLRVSLKHRHTIKGCVQTDGYRHTP